jgi:hypothetical protein
MAETSPAVHEVAFDIDQVEVRVGRNDDLASNKEVMPEDEKPIEKLPSILAAHSRVSTCSGSKTSVRLSVSSGGSFQNPGLDQLEVDWNSDVPIDFVVQNFFLKLLGLTVFNSMLAILCVAFPFGHAFRKDGENGIAANWAYYFIYNIFGWAYLFFKVILVQAFVWDKPFCFPFMKFEKGFFEANATLAALTISLVFSTVFFIIGYGIFRDPVPLGTVSFGTPCCVVCFASMYFLMIPFESRRTIRDHILIVKVLIPFIFWLLGLCSYIVLTWVLYYPINDISNNILRVFLQICTSVAFNVIRAVLSHLPLRLTIGSVNDNLSSIWRLSYRAQCSIFTMWMFPSMPNGIVAPILIVVVGIIANLLELLRAPRSTEACPTLVDLFTGLSCDVVAPISFLGIFVYNVFGPNKQYMYIIDEMNEEDAIMGVYKILLAIGAGVLKFGVILFATTKRFEPTVLTRLKNFGKISFSLYYWIIFWMLESTALACGACVIMKHDGMDLSLRFRSWSWW